MNVQSVNPAIKALLTAGLNAVLLLLFTVLAAAFAIAATWLATGKVLPIAPAISEFAVTAASVVVAVLAVLLIRRRPEDADGLRLTRTGARGFLAIVVVFFIAALAHQMLRAGFAVRTGAPAGRSVLDGTISLLASNLKWLVIANAVIVVPILEELLFRGLLLPAVMRTKLGFAGASVVVSVLFVLFHAGGAAKFTSWHILFDAHLLASLGYCLVWYLTRNVWACALAHATTNATIMLLVFGIISF